VRAWVLWHQPHLYEYRIEEVYTMVIGVLACREHFVAAGFNMDSFDANCPTLSRIGPP